MIITIVLACRDEKRSFLMPFIRFFFMGCLSFLMLSCASTHNQVANTTPSANANPAFAVPIDDPSLPRVLLIGDSISIGYTLAVREALQGIANVHRIPENGGPTTRGLEKIDEWLGDAKWDVIHFNWGLHDLKRMEDGAHQVPLAAYEKNINRLMKRVARTGATLIWCSTTPVPAVPVDQMSPPRDFTDVVRYNTGANRLAIRHGIAINNLYGYALPDLATIQRPANVHFTDEGSAYLARHVVREIKKALPE
jgi:hypothetical protein